MKKKNKIARCCGNCVYFGKDIDDNGLVNCTHYPNLNIQVRSEYGSECYEFEQKKQEHTQ